MDGQVMARVAEKYRGMEPSAMLLAHKALDYSTCLETVSGLKAALRAISSDAITLVVHKKSNGRRTK